MFNHRRRGNKNSDKQGKDPSTSQTFHSKYSGKGKKYADLNGNISIKCLNKLCLDLDIIKIPYVCTNLYRARKTSAYIKVILFRVSNKSTRII